tara:strand:+ start:679 stop:1101 length:423 start_codon:yes stop_codon:yes gene_type:complete
LHRAIFNLLFYLAFAYLFLAIFIGFKLWLFAIIGLFFCLIIFLYRQLPNSQAKQYLTLLTSSNYQTGDDFVLLQTGECQFVAQQTVQLSASSQINLWGYWLVFTANDSDLSQRFIFKDSLSAQDQARLARTIMRAKYLKG